ncbi:hypothetical protein BD626DRAFT_574788 [Schizophyllum amplum]|uniref:Uncharacterized protein n=1 Tax=Schizophyllum amplum TaxID=97359 RepID=A0A550BXD6_9AGAR|nr:hypothetical protein BD626DRAFT_574788 [Auriculariopsis ampla]
MVSSRLIDGDKSNHAASRHLGPTGNWVDALPHSVSLPDLDQATLGASDASSKTSSGRPDASTAPYGKGTSYDSDVLDDMDLNDLFDTVKDCVVSAVDTILEYGPDVLEDVLTHTGGFLHYIPAPGLAMAANALVTILRETKKVRINREECMLLTQRCARLLTDVRDDIAVQDDELVEGLEDAVERVAQKMMDIQRFLTKRNDSAFLTRLIDREGMKTEIQQYTRQLDAAYVAWSNSLKFLTLRRVKSLHAQRATLSPSASWEVVELAEEAARLMSQGKVEMVTGDLAELFVGGIGQKAPSRSITAEMPNSLPTRPSFTLTLEDGAESACPDCSPSSSTSTEKMSPPAAHVSAGNLLPDVKARPRTALVDNAGQAWLGDARSSWLGNPADREVRYPTLSAAQIARVKAQLRQEMTELDMQEKLAELRIFIDLAVQMDGALLSLLAHEGSHIPVALRVLSALRVTELEE